MNLLTLTNYFKCWNIMFFLIAKTSAFLSFMDHCTYKNQQWVLEHWGREDVSELYMFSITFNFAVKIILILWAIFQKNQNELLLSNFFSEGVLLFLGYKDQAILGSQDPGILGKHELKEAQTLNLKFDRAEFWLTCDMT